MSLRRFLNVAFAILVEEYQRMGLDLLTALEKVSEWSEGVTVTTVPGVSAPAVAARNEQSMEMLQGILAGVQGAPKRRPRRA